MTEVRMYVRVAERLPFLYNLLSRKIVPRGIRAFVFVPDEEEAARVDKYLWTAKAGEFLPHALAESEAAADSPAVIGGGVPAADFYGGILVSWAAEVPPFFGEFAMVADITENRAHDLHSARLRFKAYRESGCAIDSHDMNPKGG